MEKLRKDIETSEREHNDDTHEVFALMTSRCKFIEPDEIFPLKKYQFQNLEFFGPFKADIILKRTYGDFMKLPPVEERIGHYSSVEFY